MKVPTESSSTLSANSDMDLKRNLERGGYLRAHQSRHLLIHRAYFTAPLASFSAHYSVIHLLGYVFSRKPLSN